MNNLKAKMMKTLVTGCASFTGSHLVDKLLGLDETAEKVLIQLKSKR